VYVDVKEVKRLVHAVERRCRNTRCIDCAGVYVYAGGAAAAAYLEAARGHGQAAGNSAMHHYMRMHLCALAPACSRAGHGGRHLISALFRGGA